MQPVNLDRLKPYHPRVGSTDPPGPVSDPGQEGEHVVEQLLNRKTLRGRTYYLVRWQGYASADDSWEPVEHLAHCPERVAEYEAAAPRRPQALRARQRAAAPSAEAAPSVAAPPPAGVPPPSPRCSPSTGSSAGLVSGSGGWLAGAGRSHPLLVAGRGLAVRSSAAPQPPDPIHPRCGLPAPHGGLCGRGGLASGRGLVWFSLGCACPSARVGSARNGTTVRVLSAGPARSPSLWAG